MSFHASDYRWSVWLLQAVGGAAMFLVAAFLGFLFGQGGGWAKILSVLCWLIAAFFAVGTVICFVMGIIRLAS
ncbi:MAG TPA: hypothetical protein VI488_09235 [Candidatus Angelobacter sp.]